MRNKIKGYRIKLLSSILLVLAILSLCACAANKNLEINEEALTSNLSGMMAYVSMAAGSEEGKAVKKMEIEELSGLLKSSRAPFTAHALVNAIDGYEQVIESSGGFIDIKGVEFNSSAKEINAKATCQFEKRIVNINAVIDEDGIIRSLSFAPEYTAAEIGQKALINTVIGMCMVFLILALIAFIISLLKYIPKGGVVENKDIIKAEEKTVFEDYNNSDNLVDDLELVAVITAAITEFESLPDDSSFVVREIRRREENRW